MEQRRAATITNGDDPRDAELPKPPDTVVAELLLDVCQAHSRMISPLLVMAGSGV